MNVMFDLLHIVEVSRLNSLRRRGKVNMRLEVRLHGENISNDDSCKRNHYLSPFESLDVTSVPIDEKKEAAC